MTPGEMIDFVDSFQSERVRVHFDTGNIMMFQFPEHWISILGKRIKNVHLKEFTKKGTDHSLESFRPLLDGTTNWPAVMEAFDATGYRGYLTFEYFHPYPHYPEGADLSDVRRMRIDPDIRGARGPRGGEQGNMVRVSTMVGWPLRLAATVALDDQGGVLGVAGVEEVVGKRGRGGGERACPGRKGLFGEFTVAVTTATFPAGSIDSSTGPSHRGVFCR